jgi:predicted TIM-barrel fold metal-dependent hydrolase
MIRATMISADDQQPDGEGKAPAEPILEPALPIIDTHHHLWERRDHRYLLDELLADLNTGHNVVATVFVECHAMYIELCIERFGASRCMFESNFPVEKMGIGYAALWNALKRIAADASDDEKSDLFSGTARRAYRLA